MSFPVIPIIAIGGGLLLLVASKGGTSSKSSGNGGSNDWGNCGGGGDGRQEPDRCIYQIYNWSTTQNKAVNHRAINKPYSDVYGDERDPNDPRCTVCEGDQVTIYPSQLGLAIDPFKVCWAHKDGMIKALSRIKATGKFDLKSLTAYRPGRTRGTIIDGLRTEMSNHSYGTAIDINRSQNGLYKNCNVTVTDAKSIQNCTLSHGGHWNPQTRPLTSIARDGDVVRIMREELGWDWGGKVPGSTKDLMHFSKDGR